MMLSTEQFSSVFRSSPVTAGSFSTLVSTIKPQETNNITNTTATTTTVHQQTTSITHQPVSTTTLQTDGASQQTSEITL